MKLSPSALERYRRCPKSFLLTDLERSPRREAPTGPLVMGNAVHAALERFYGLAAIERTEENMERALRHVWVKNRKPGAFINAHEEAAYGRQAIAMLREHAARLSDGVVPLAREQWVEAEIASGVRVFGKIDRVDKLTSGMGIVDYKTGKVGIDESELAGESAVQVYVCAAEATFGQQVESVTFIYLAAGVELRWFPEREDVEALAARLVRLGERIAAEETFAAFPGSHCSWCPAALRCPDRAMVAVEELVAGEEVPF